MALLPLSFSRASNFRDPAAARGGMPTACLDSGGVRTSTGSILLMWVQILVLVTGAGYFLVVAERNQVKYFSIDVKSLIKYVGSSFGG